MTALHAWLANDPEAVDPRYRVIHEDDDGAVRAFDIRDVGHHELIDPDVREAIYWSVLADIDEAGRQMLATVRSHVQASRPIEERLAAIPADVLEAEQHLAHALRLLNVGQL